MEEVKYKGRKIKVDPDNKLHIEGVQVMDLSADDKKAIRDLASKQFVDRRVKDMNDKINKEKDPEKLKKLEAKKAALMNARASGTIK